MASMVISLFGPRKGGNPTRGSHRTGHNPRLCLVSDPRAMIPCTEARIKNTRGGSLRIVCKLFAVCPCTFLHRSAYLRLFFLSDLALSH